jgi:adenylylsulfate kinase-like enzyme
MVTPMSHLDQERTPKVLLLNGPAGVGKTTVGTRLAATADNGACVHGDDLKHFVVARIPGTVDQGLSYVGGAKLADVFLEAGYDLVVFEFIFLHAAHIQRFMRSLQTELPVHLVTLWAPLTVVSARDAARPQPERQGAEHLSELGAVLDASGSVEKLVADVCQCLESRASLLPRESAATTA